MKKHNYKVNFNIDINYLEPAKSIGEEHRRNQRQAEINAKVWGFGHIIEELLRYNDQP